MILTVAAFKGGVAKTTTAVHLAAYLAEKGSVALIDGDPNRSATGWAARGELPFQVVPYQQLGKVARQVEHLVIDTEARPATEDLKELLEGGDLLVVPTTPDAMSLEATDQTVAQLRRLGADAGRFRCLLTIVPPPPSKVGQDAAEWLRSENIPVLGRFIRRYMAFQNAAAAGVPVFKVNDRTAQRAWEDYRGAAEELLGAAAALP